MHQAVWNDAQQGPHEHINPAREEDRRECSRILPIVPHITSLLEPFRPVNSCEDLQFFICDDCRIDFLEPTPVIVDVFV